MKKKKEIAYHFTGDKLRDGRPIPAVGEWLEENGEIEICKKGLHASRTPFAALSFAPGFSPHKVEVEGIVAETDDKLVARRRRIIATIDAKDLIVSFARKQSLSVVHLFDCPSILKQWLDTGDLSIQKEARTAAYAAAVAADTASASVYRASAAAASAAAAYAAYAAYAADADAAAYAAYAAYVADADAADAAAYADAKKKAADTFNREVEKAFESLGGN